MSGFSGLLSLHIVFLAVWSATLVYMPYLFLQQVATAERESCERAMLMQRWLYANVMTPAAVLTVVAGVWLIFERGFTGGWLQVKLALVLGMAFFHVYCGHLMVHLKRDASVHRRLYYHALPAAPALLIGAIVWLVTGKPF